MKRSIKESTLAMVNAGLGAYVANGLGLIWGVPFFIAAAFGIWATVRSKYA
jgi:hypothetical protein